jgi:LemA protein
MIVLAVLGGLLVLVIFWAVAQYNGLVTLRNRGDNSWADIDVQLKRRHDLVPNLVETVKGYAAHERGTLENVTKARQQAVSISGGTPEERARAESQLSGVLRSLFAVAENYPQLRANENFLGLQKSLQEIEDALQNARRYYNAVVRDFNTRQDVFPGNVVARAFGFVKRQYFEIGDAAERAVPQVKF